MAAELLESILEAAAQAPGMVGGLLGAKELGEQIALGGERRSQTVGDEADLVFAFGEAHGFALPDRAQEPRLPISDLGAIALLARALGQADAAAGAEEVVVGDGDEAAGALFRRVADAELEPPGLRLPHIDL